MKNESKKKIANNFKEAFDNYLEAVRKSFYSRHGEEPDISSYEKKIVLLYQKIPKEERAYLLYFIIKTMSQPTGDSRFTDSRRSHALELTKKLEKIK